MIMKVFTTYLDQNLMIKMVNIKKPQQSSNIDTKPVIVFNYFRSLSQNAKDLMDEIEDANDEIYVVSFFLLVVIRKNLTLILLINH